MKSEIFALAIGIIMIMCLFTSCNIGNDQENKGNGNVINQERELDEFKGIVLNGVGNVNVHSGEDYKIKIRTDSNLQDRVLTTVKNNTLRISQSSGSFNATELTIDVYMPELKSILLDGTGNFIINNSNSTELNVSLSGTGNVDAQNFQAQDVTITHSGVGNIKIWAINSLNGTFSGVGDILYKGNPTININRTGIGNISPL
jgi:hypothetical protein